MATSLAPTAPAPGEGRAQIRARTLRRDRWWLSPNATAVYLFMFVGYGMYAAWANANYYWKPYISPFYSPCVASICNHARAGSHYGIHVPNLGIFGTWWVVSPAVIIVLFPLGFRLTCYYYRKAYYRGFWRSPPACAVAEPHKRYTGESRFPLILQNVHRYFFYIALLFNGVLTYDAVVAFQNHQGQWGHAGFGTLMLVINAIVLWGYTLGCHACRHVIGGRLKHFSRHPIRYKAWGVVSWFNERHMQFAWISLTWVALTDLYVRLVAAGWVTDPRFF